MLRCAVLIFLIFGLFVNAFENESLEKSSNPHSYRFKRALKYGNHCGRHVGTPGEPIVDAYDRCCYKHDRCLEEDNSWHGKECHVRLSNCFARVIIGEIYKYGKIPVA